MPGQKTDGNAQEREAIAARLEQVRRLAQQGRTSDALALCRHIEESAPQNPEVLCWMGILYTRTGALAQGLAHLAAALLITPNDPLVLYQLAQVYLQAGAPIHALHSLRNYAGEAVAARVLPDLPDAAGQVALLTTFLREDRALTGLAESTRDRALMAAERGRLRLLFSDDPAKAVPDLKEAIRLAPRYAPPRNNLSIALFYDGRPGEARANLETTLRDLGPNVYALATLAFVRWAEGEPTEVVQPLLDQAVDALGRESRLLDRTRLAEVAGALGDHARAAATLDLPPESPEEAQLEGLAVQQAAARLRATAEANQGQADAALDRLRALPTPVGDPRITRLATAIADGATLPAVAGGGYPYLRWDDLTTPHALRRALGTLGGRRTPWGLASPPSLDGLATRLTALGPRLPLAGALMLWAGGPDESFGLSLLGLAATPAADAILDAHLRGTLGSMSGRQAAGYLLLDGGQLSNGSTVRFWSGSDWTDLQLFRLAPRARDRAALLETLRAGLARMADEAHLSF